MRHALITDDTAGAALEAARTIASEGAIPLLMVSGDPARAAAPSGGGAAMAGPFTLGEIDEAVHIALGRGLSDPIMERGLCAANVG